MARNSSPGTSPEYGVAVGRHVDHYLHRNWVLGGQEATPQQVVKGRSLCINCVGFPPKQVVDIKDKVSCERPKY